MLPWISKRWTDQKYRYILYQFLFSLNHYSGIYLAHSTDTLVYSGNDARPNATTNIYRQTFNIENKILPIRLIAFTVPHSYSESSIQLWPKHAEQIIYTLKLPHFPFRLFVLFFFLLSSTLVYLLCYRLFSLPSCDQVVATGIMFESLASQTHRFFRLFWKQFFFSFFFLVSCTLINSQIQRLSAIHFFLSSRFSLTLNTWLLCVVYAAKRSIGKSRLDIFLKIISGYLLPIFLFFSFVFFFIRFLLIAVIWCFWCLHGFIQAFTKSNIKCIISVDS